MSSVANVLTGAKTALANAEKFSSSAGDSGHMFAPKHEYSNASYGAARSARKSAFADRNQEAKSLGEGLHARMESEAAAKKSIQ